jgi:glycosyltransferase involved in cell wall biosynthesis
MSSDHIRYSFVIPTYNRANLVISSVQSALAWLGHNPDGEIIVIDNASQDGTVARLEAVFAQEISHDLVRVLAQQRNGGVIRSKNIGGRTARGRWIIYLDSDDLIKPTEAAAMRAALSTFESAPIVFFRCEDIQTGELIGIAQSHPTELSLREYLNDKRYAECLPVLRKDIFDRFPYDESLDGWEGLTYARILQAEGPIIVSPIIARRYRSEGADRLTSPQGLKRRARSMARGHWLMLWKYGSFLSLSSRFRQIAKVAYYHFRSLT